jgi:glycosyltransferase involved in cell wall biosynthesis
MRILLEAPILTESGYGVHSRLIYDSLKDKGYQIYTSVLNWGNTSWDTGYLEENPDLKESILRYGQFAEASKQNNNLPQFDIQIRVGIANEFEKKAQYSVLVTAGIETDRVSAEWLMRTHRGIDKIIVPSNHAKLSFIHTSYEVFNKANQQKTVLECACPVEVIPYPVVEHEKVDLNLNVDTNFNFLTIALLGPRKNIENSVSWFLEEFKDNPDVGLIIKTARAKNSLLDRDYTRKLLKAIRSRYKKSKCKLYLLHGSLTSDEIHSLIQHESVKAYYSTTHGEGYGLPIFEAAYSGVPVVATDWSAHVEFLTAPYKENGKTKDKKLFAKIDYDIGEVPKSAIWEPLIIEGSRWAYPKEASVKQQMRKMYKNYGMYKKWALSLQAHILENYKKENILNRMFEELIPESFRALPTQKEASLEIEEMFSSLSN